VAAGLFVSFALVGEVVAQETGTVRGTVTDADNGEVLPGANVVMVGTQQGAATNADGEYAIKGIEPGTYSIRASFLGYQEVVRENVQVRAGETSTINFSLQQQQQALDELVVVGYGEQERGDVTAAVSQVSSEDLEDIQTTSVDQALQGQASGVEVTSAGSPGSGAIVRIRGLSTTNNNDPLFVVDGVPTGGIEGLNPGDIESIEVLKDASAAAIYGSRAANGVVLVSTKSGREGDFQVNFSSSMGVQRVPEGNRLDLLNTQQYDEFNTTLAQNTPDVSVPSRLANDAYENQTVDWQDAVFQSGVTTTNSLGVSGGSENAQYRVSLGYTSEEGAIIETGFERYSARVNSSFDLGRFNVSENLSITYRKQRPMRTNEVLGLAQRYPPYLSVRDESNVGGFNGPDQADGFDDPSPVRIQENGYEHDKITKVLGNLTGEARIVEGLTFRQVAGLDAEYGTYDNFEPPFREGEFESQDYSTITENRFSVFSPLITSTLNFDRTFESHSVSAVGGYELNVTYFSDSEVDGRNPLTLIEVPQSITEETSVDGIEGTDVLQSVFGRVNYNYDGRYLLQASLRRDGYSRFGPQNKNGLFPSGSVGWVLSEESFLEDASSLSNLKLRGSYGITGNNNAVDRYEYQATVTTGFEYPLSGGPAAGASIVGMANENLRWETSRSLNVGADIGLFGQALTFTAEYYKNTTEDILLQVSLPGSFGFAADPRANTGTVESSGFEFAAGYQSQNSEGFNWSVDANFSTASNEVTSLGRGNPLTGADWQQAEGTSTRIEEGEPIWFFWGWKVDRLFQEDDFDENGNLQDGIPDQAGSENDPQPGDVKFVDVNGDGVITDEDRTRVGSPHPDFFYGLSGSVTFKNFDASVSLQGAAGNQILRDYAYWTEGMQRINNHSTKVLDHWTPNNTDTDIPRAVAGSGDPNENNRMSDRWISDGDYLRIKRLTIGYELPFGDRLRRARLYVQSENLYTFTGYEGYDPEVSARDSETGDASRGIDTGQYVQPRSFRVGVQLDF
jgi:TonB-linked SusC/RagA family outer membrane protein